MKTANADVVAPLGVFPLSVYLEAGREAFERAAVRLAELEQAADLEPGSLVDQLAGGFAFGQAQEPHGASSFILGGWDCSHDAGETEAALAAAVARWTTSPRA